MADSYLAIAAIANDKHMQERVRACYAQQTETLDPTHTVWQTRYDWASAPGWGASWESALANGIEEPGKDPAVISDAQILSQVQAMLDTTGGKR